MAVLFRVGFIGEKTAQRLKAAGIPVQWMGDAQGTGLAGGSPQPSKGRLARFAIRE